MFVDKDGIRHVCFGGGTVAFAHSKAYEDKNGMQVEVQLRDPGEPHPISKMTDCPAEVIKTYPTKVILGFNKLESFDAFMSCLEEARAELAAAQQATANEVKKG